VRFLGDGRVVLSVREVEQAITAFTNAVLAKIEGLEHEEVARLRRDWQAVGDSMREEETLCRNLAKLGLDPYGVEDEQIDRLEGALAAIPPSLRSDLLDSDNLEGLAASAGYAERSSRLVAQGRGPAFHASLVVPPRSSVPAHEVGYRVAHDFRKAVGIAHDRGVADLQGLLEQHAAAVRAETLPGPDGTRVKGVVGFAPTTRAAVLVTPRERPPTTLRFLLGRALGACLLGQCDQGPRLLTDALTWEQAATRAFSAELLAPQAALAQRVRAEVSSDEVQKLAQEFEVSQLLIEHQIENHQLARVVPD
jgi:hypothetical protein